MKSAIGTILVVFSLLACPLRSDGRVYGYITQVPPESVEAAAARHKMVAGRRAGPIVICHRGGSSFAPENTLEAFNAALDYGADGAEVDIALTSDGVPVCFHDCAMDRLTDTFGVIPQFTYAQLTSVRPLAYGTAGSDTGIPTFAALLELARQRGLLIWLDIKVEGADSQVARLLDEADSWDHVIGIENYNCDKIKASSSYRPQQCLRWLFDEGDVDWDPAEVKKSLPPPGKAIMVNDPRLAAHELGRPAYSPAPIPESVYAQVPPREKTGARSFCPLVCTRLLSRRMDGASVSDVVALLSCPADDRTRIDGAQTYQLGRTRRLFARIWAASKLAKIRCSDAAAIQALEYQVAHPTCHAYEPYNNADRLAALRALAEIGSTASVPALIRASNPDVTDAKLSYPDAVYRWRLVQALRDLPCDASRSLLRRIVSADPGSDSAWRWLRYDASLSLASMCSSSAELAALVGSKDSSIRAAAIRYCLDHPSQQADAALETAARWALGLPTARQ